MCSLHIVAGDPACTIQFAVWPRQLLHQASCGLWCHLPCLTNPLSVTWKGCRFCQGTAAQTAEGFPASPTHPPDRHNRVHSPKGQALSRIFHLPYGTLGCRFCPGSSVTVGGQEWEVWWALVMDISSSIGRRWMLPEALKMFMRKSVCSLRKPSLVLLGGHWENCGSEPMPSPQGIQT